MATEILTKDQLPQANRYALEATWEMDALLELLLREVGSEKVFETPEAANDGSARLRAEQPVNRATRDTQ